MVITLSTHAGKPFQVERGYVTEFRCAPSRRRNHIYTARISKSTPDCKMATLHVALDRS